MSSLFYVLSASGSVYKPVAVLGNLAPGQMNQYGFESVLLTESTYIWFCLISGVQYNIYVCVLCYQGLFIFVFSSL